jgi:hypothetical protein
MRLVNSLWKVRLLLFPSLNPQLNKTKPGLYEGLARKVSSFGIRVLIVQPGAFRTNFLSSFKTPNSKMSDAYKGTAVESTLQYVSDMNGKQRGDVEKGVSVIFDVVTGKKGEGVLRVPLGSDCMGRFEKKVEGMNGDLEAVRGFVCELDVKK